MKWLVAILLIAAALRIPQLSERPMHADEAVLADRAGTLVETRRFTYDPTEHHGPVFAYVTLAAARIAGVSNYAAFTEAFLRAIAVMCGLALVALSFFAARALAGNEAAIFASLFTALSPALVYYSRFYIPEMLFVMLSAAGLLAIMHGGRVAAIALGAIVGLMAGTKETAAIVIVAALLAFRLSARMLLTSAAIGAATVAGIYWQSVIALLTAGPVYVQRAIDGGRHAHGILFYFELLLKSGDLLWLALGAFGVRSPQTRALGLYAITLTLLYSVIRYKTPWCALGFVHAWILLAAVTAAQWWRVPRYRVLIVPVLLALTGRAWQLSIPLAAETANPWAYAQTSRDIFQIRNRVLATAKGGAIHIVTVENWWPLPWYLRGQASVQWWTVVPPKLDGLVLVSPSLEQAAAAAIYNRLPGDADLYAPLFDRAMWLRPGVEVRGYAPLTWVP